MTQQEITKAIEKGFEVWTLQNLLNLSIVLGLLACGLSLIQDYYRSLEKRLSLRVSIELWQIMTTLVVDVFLVIVVLVGYLVLNPDIMADIKIALPFCPAATVVFAAALVLRLFHGGHEVASKNYLWALYLMFAANLLNIIGFTFIMEAPSKDYLKNKPSVFWDYLKTHLRSNADPHGLELSQATFYVCFPLLLAVFAWGALAGLRHIRRPTKG
jgi:hypothetical protein